MRIVPATKYRKRLLINGIDDFLKKACSYPAEQNDWNIIAMETDKDHIHILPEYDAAERICDIISSLKRQTTYITCGYVTKMCYPDNIGGNISSN